MLEDHQLDKLASFTRPVALALAGVAFGSVISLLPTVVQASHHLGTNKFDLEDLTYSIVEAVVLLITVSSGTYAAIAERDVRRLLRDIRKRGTRRIE